MKPDPAETMQQCEQRFKDALAQWGDPVQFPHVEWSDVEKARREAVNAAAHYERTRE